MALGPPGPAQPAQQRPVYTPPVQKKPEQAKTYTSEKKSSGSTLCFITTAVCEYLGKPDDCPELMDFRGFRDNWLRFQPGGAELIREYYECAPELVRKMKASPAYERICRVLWSDYLIPCRQMIHKQELEQCRNHYVAMVEFLRRAVEW